MLVVLAVAGGIGILDVLSGSMQDNVYRLHSTRVLAVILLYMRIAWGLACIRLVFQLVPYVYKRVAPRVCLQEMRALTIWYLVSPPLASLCRADHMVLQGESPITL